MIAGIWVGFGIVSLGIMGIRKTRISSANFLETEAYVDIHNKSRLLRTFTPH
jgi:hypothetical protein